MIKGPWYVWALLVAAAIAQEPVTLQEMLSGQFGQRGFNGSWISDTNFTYTIAGQPGIYAFNVETLTSSVLVPGDLMAFLNTSNPVLSPDGRFILASSEVEQDECTMAHRKAVEAVDRTLRDIRQNDRPMGGITVLFCGDFRQTLTVIPRGTRAAEVRACLKSSYLWRDIQSVHLTINMRVRTVDNPDDREFSDILLKKIPSPKIPIHCYTKENLF
ncbi:hypothetical protein evm_002114 [Chilo suppressalis]|nr:hypothetical protein evm_002114 [Chilo suppressalis]